jgi:MraZ protein
MFQGATSLNLDAKARLAIPARHRERLSDPAGGTIVLTAHPHGCLLVYPVQVWEPLSARLTKLPNLDQRSATLKRLFIGYARYESLDSAGRVLVSPEQRQWAGLKKEAWLVGQGDHFELWSDESWKREQEKMVAIADQPLPPGFEDLVL